LIVRLQKPWNNDNGDESGDDEEDLHTGIVRAHVIVEKVQVAGTVGGHVQKERLP